MARQRNPYDISTHFGASFFALQHFVHYLMVPLCSLLSVLKRLKTVACRKDHSANQSDCYVKDHTCHIVNLQKRKVTTCGLGDVERTRVSIDHHLARAPFLMRLLWVLSVNQPPKVVKILCLMPSLEVPTVGNECHCLASDNNGFERGSLTEQVWSWGK